MHSSANNQRDFYRVDCRVVVSQRAIGERVPRGLSADSHFPDSELFAMLRELRRLDHESSHMLHAIGEKDRNVEAYLGHLNRKFDLLARHLVSLTPAVTDGSEQTVSLSEGGIQFHANPPPPRGTMLAIRLTLLPSHVGLAIYGSVVAVGAEERNVSVRFENLQDADRQILARHVMQVQMSQKRLSRGGDAADPLAREYLP